MTTARAPRLLLVALAAAAMIAPGIGSARPDRCAGFRVDAQLGPVCPNADGSLRVYGRDGALLGTTHGSDRVPAQGRATSGSVTTAAATPAPPACASASDAYHFVAIYARAMDDLDEYATKLTSIRSMFSSVNGIVRQAAAAKGDDADVELRCTNGEVDVANVVLPTTRSSASFSTIASDLKAQGFDDPKLKYAVFYDDTSACECGGQATYADDERASEANYNNGNWTSPLYAIDYGYLHPSVMLHEMAHTLGAVGTHAPHSTGARHCYDGADVMCYDDGGPKGSLYSTTYCAVEVFDCGADDYFNPRPAAGSYLALNWNLASRAIRYITFPRPIVASLSCPAKAGVGRATACSFAASDDSPGVAFTIAWGDGTTTRSPSSGFVAPGSTSSASHVYGTTGWYTVSVTATDDASPPQTSTPLTAALQVVADTQPPVLLVQDPAPATLYNGCATKQPLAGVPPMFVQRGCVKVNASDSGAGLWKVSVYMGASHMGTRYAGPYTFEFPVTLPGTREVPIRIEAWDWAGNVTTETVNVLIL